MQKIKQIKPYHLLSLWYFFTCAYFILLLCSLYNLKYSMEFFPYEFHVILSIVILICSILISGILPTFLRNNRYYLYSFSILKTLYYIFLLIIGSLFLSLVSPLGFEDLKLELILSVNFSILGFSSCLEFYFSWDHLIERREDEKSISLVLKLYLIALFSSLTLSIYFFIQPSFMNVSIFRVYTFAFIFFGGDLLCAVLFERIIEYWTILGNEKPITTQQKPKSSFFLSHKFYKFIFLPAYSIFLCFFIIISLSYFSLPTAYHETTLLVILIGIKAYLIVDFYYHYTKIK